MNQFGGTKDLRDKKKGVRLGWLVQGQLWRTLYVHEGRQNIILTERNAGNRNRAAFKYLFYQLCTMGRHPASVSSSAKWVE